METANRLLGCVLACCTACSWISVKKPPPYPFEEGQPVACTSSSAAPVVDTVLAPTLAVSAVVYYAVTSSLNETLLFGGDSRTKAASIVPAALMGAGAIALGFSAYYGNRHTGSCRTALACQSGDREACASLDVTRALARGRDDAKAKEASPPAAGEKPPGPGRLEPASSEGAKPEPVAR